MKIVSCQVNHLSDPLGYRLGTPVFHWQVEEAAGKWQTAARIQVYREGAPLWDTGWAQLDSLATPLPLELTPRTRYTWTVSVRTDAGEEAVSGENVFETGKMDEPWLARWIGCDNSEPRHPIFCKDILPTAPVTRARLYICGLGLYEAFWNGEKIGREMLTPYCNNYHAWLQAQTYDMTEQLQNSGTLSVLLGNGWYKGRFGYEGKAEPYYGKEWKLIAELHLTYQDGSTQVIGTDESWLVKRSRLTFSNIYDGERRDDTLPELPTVYATPIEAPGAPLSDRLSPAVEVQEELPVQALIHTPAGETVLDMGQNFAGSFRLFVDAPAEAEIRLQFGEILQNGNFYRDNLRTAKAEYRYMSSGTPKTISPHFTFYGYRYVKIEGLESLRPEDFTGLALYSQMPRTGRIVTGSELLNQLIHNIEWGQKGNFLDVPTDCPQRDERMGWTGDAQVFAPTACYQRDSAAFYTKFLYDLSTEQAANSGSAPRVVPSFGDTETSAAWGDAACVIPMVLYRFYGDRELLRRQYPSMKAWVRYMAAVDGEDNGWRRHFHYGDWLALDGPGGLNGMEGGTDKGLIASTYQLYSTRLAAQAARVLGEKTDQKELDALADKLLRAIRQEYFSPLGRCCVDTQTAYLLALRHGLGVDEGRIAEALTEKLRKNNGKLQTGFVGTPLLCEELSRTGHGDMAYDLLLNEDYPGWLYAVKLGATTVWERWNSVLPDGRISGSGMNSLNHYAYGSIAQWLYARCAGIAPMEDSPGFRKALLRPMPDARLGRLNAEFRSAAGVWSVAWEVSGDSCLTLSVTVPFHCEGLLTLPCAPDEVFRDGSNPMFADVRDGVCRLPAGTYSVRYHTDRPLRMVYTTYLPLRELLRVPQVKGFLLQAIPTLSQLPDMMLDMSMRDIAARMGGGHVGPEMLDQLDAALKQITIN